LKENELIYKEIFGLIENEFEATMCIPQVGSIRYKIKTSGWIYFIKNAVIFA